MVPDSIKERWSTWRRDIIVEQKTQLKLTCVEECQTKKEHFLREKEINGAFEDRYHAIWHTSEFVVVAIIISINDTCVLCRPKHGEKEEADESDAN